MKVLTNIRIKSQANETSYNSLVTTRGEFREILKIPRITTCQGQPQQVHSKTAHTIVQGVIVEEKTNYQRKQRAQANKKDVDEV